MKTKFNIKMLLLLLTTIASGVYTNAQVGPISIGTLPKNKSIKLVYNVTIANPVTPAGTTSLTHQGFISGTNLLPSVYTDDPDSAGYPHNPPVATITMIDLPPFLVSINRQNPVNQYTNATSVTFRVAFSEPVSGVNSLDFSASISNGLLMAIVGTPVPVAGTNSSTYDVTLSSITGTGELSLGVNSSGTGIVDQSNQPLTVDRPVGQTYILDQESPVLNPVTIVSDGANTSYAKVGDVITLSFTSSEVLAGTPTVTIAGQTATVTITGGNNYHATYMMTSANSEGVIPFTINFADLAGNVGAAVVTVTSGTGVIFDKTAPVLVSIQRYNPSQATITATSVVYRVTFSEVVSNITLYDFSLIMTGSVSADIASVSAGTASVVDVTINSISGVGDLELDLYTNTIIDAASNAIGYDFNHGEKYTLVSAPSVVSINRQSPATELTNASSVTYRISFSKDVTGVDAGDFTLTATGTVANGVVGSVVTATANSVYDVTITGVTGDGTLRLDLKASGTGIQDNIANAITGGFTTGQIYTFDHTAPTLTTVKIYSANTNHSYAKVGDMIFLDFFATEELKDAPVVTLDGRSLVVINLEDYHYSAATAMLSTDAEGLLPFTISFQDLAGNTGSTVTLTTDHSSVTFDKTAPTGYVIERYNPTEGVVTTSSLVFRVTFPEILTGIDVTSFNVGVTGTATGTISSVSASTASVVYVSIINVSGVGDLSLHISSTSLYDLAGNSYDDSGGGISEEYSLVTAPFVMSINRQSPAAEFTKASSVTFRITFSKDVTGVDITDFAVNMAGPNLSGVMGSVITVTANSVYDVSILNLSGDGTLRLDLNASGTGIKDNIGNDILDGFTTGESYSIDHAAPTLPYVHLTSDHSYYAKPGNIISLSFQADETIATPIVTIAGNTVTPTNSAGNYWFAQYTMTSADAEGPVPFSISFTDLAGNAGNTVTVTTDYSWVTFDKTPPVATVVKMYSNNTNNQYAKTGDIVYLEFKFSEHIYPLTVLINGNPPTGMTQLMNGNIQARYQMPASADEGPVSFSLSDFLDDAGNAGQTITITTDESSVTFDKTAPYLTYVNMSSRTSHTNYVKVGDEATLTFTSSEPLTFPPNVLIDGHTYNLITGSGNTYTVTYIMSERDVAGTVSFTISYKDLAGNSGATTSSTTDGSALTFDKTAPTLTTVTISSTNSNPAHAKTGDVVNLTFTGSEALNSPMATIAGRTVTPVVYNGGYRASTTMISSDAEGIIPFSITYVDLAGNTGSIVTTTTDASSVTFDKTAPYVMSSLRHDPLTAGTLSTTIIFQVSFSEAVSGVALSDFTLTATSPSSGTIASIISVSTSVYNISVNVTNGGGGTLRLDVKASGTAIADAAGNPIAGGFTAGETYTFGIPPSITCPSTKTFTNAGGTCIVSASTASLTSGATLGGLPTPTFTILAGTTTITSSANLSVGTTTITLVASNGILPNASCEYTVNVVDVLAPTVSGLTVSPTVLWPPNHKLREVYLNYLATDLCGTVTTTVSISSNEPQNNTSDGDKEPDWIVDPSNPLHLQLRGERANGGNGRVYTIVVTATDAAGNTSSATVPVYVVHNITNPLTGSPYKIGSTVSFGGVFWDKAGNTHTGQWLIDGTTTAKGIVTEPSGNKNGKVTGSYRFNSAGVYKLQMNVTDQNRNTSYCYTNEDQEAIVVIYDPNGGYTYGGGYFNSPAGALTSDPSFTGKANYGYTINYYKGATFPKGETQFNLIAADFEFNALNFDYMVISGAKAQFKGSGKITGDISGVNFIMTVIDGQLDGTGIDKVHMKIYNKNTGYIYYDNEPGASEADNPLTAVGINSIVYIFNSSPKAHKVITTDEVVSSSLLVLVHPNPANTEFQAIASSADKVAHIEMQVFDVQGRVVERFLANEGQTIRFGDSYKNGLYYLRAIQGDKHTEVKIVKLPD